MTTQLQERTIKLKEGERLKIQFVMADGSIAEQYAVVENRPAGYRTGDGRSGPGRNHPVGAVSMKHPGGNGSYQTLGLDARSRLW